MSDKSMYDYNCEHYPDCSALEHPPYNCSKCMERQEEEEQK